MSDQPQRIKRSEAIARAGGLDALADWLRANNYNPIPVNLLYPDVPLEDEGVYYNGIIKAYAAMILTDLQVPLI